MSDHVLPRTTNLDDGDIMSMISDWIQADAAILWDRRPGGNVQLSAFGLTLEEITEILARCADSLASHIEGDRRAVLVLSEIDLRKLLHLVRRSGAIDEDTTYFRERFDYALRRIRP